MPVGDALDNRRVMDAIAAPFDATRQRPWPQVESFLEQLPEHARVLDLAAGNGRHTTAASRRGQHAVAVDVSGHLLRRIPRIAPPGRIAIVEADALHLPFRDACFDAGVFIAGLHSIRARASRAAALEELHRVLDHDAPALVSVWARGQPRLERKAVDLSGARGHEPGDVLVPWGKDLDEPVQRFFHLYALDELLDEVLTAGFQVIAHESVDLTGQGVPDNHFVTLRKGS